MSTLMLSWLAGGMAPEIRILLAALTALALALLFGGATITWLSKRMALQVIRDHGPRSHGSKAGTPTMGGILILGTLTISLLLWADLGNRLLWTALLTTLAFGVLGGADDWLKIRTRDAAGLRAKWKYFWQTLIAMTAVVFLYVSASSPVETRLHLPFFEHLTLQAGVGYVLLAYFVVVGSSNAVNLTDGLDGLASLPSALVAGGIGVLAYLAGQDVFATLFHTPFVPGALEVAVFCGALAGGALGFLYYNRYPARLFMGDAGSLSLGAALGIAAVIVKQEVLFALMSAIFVFETLSVILQVLSFQLQGRRIFLMAPFHHHLEYNNWSEQSIVTCFWLITLVMVAAVLTLFLVRGL